MARFDFLGKGKSKVLRGDWTVLPVVEFCSGGLSELEPVLGIISRVLALQLLLDLTVGKKKEKKRIIITNVSLDNYFTTQLYNTAKTCISPRYSDCRRIE